MPHTDAHLEPFTTSDGSVTLRDRDRDLLYRSKHGAATESRELFVEGTGLVRRTGDWVVLEFGFGGGMSFAQALIARNQRPTGHLHFHSVERDPVDPALAQHLPKEAAAQVAQALEQARACGEAHITSGHTTLHLYKASWKGFERPDIQAHALFHDPFGPEVDPGSWDRDAMAVAAAHIAPDGILATYTMAAHVRRAIAAAGLWVARAPGPGFKREVTLASPSAQALAHVEILTKYTPTS